MSIMNREFDPVLETELHPDDFGEGAYIYLIVLQISVCNFLQIVVSIIHHILIVVSSLSDVG